MAKESEATISVAIFDDEPAKANHWKEKIESLGATSLKVNAFSNDQIEAELATLYERRQAIDGGRDGMTINSRLDDVDVLIVDFDLRDLNQHRGFATGEEIAYSVRLFSKAKIVVVVNHPNFGLDNFDLTLQRDREFRADAYVGHIQLLNRGLWLPEAGHEGFLPWSWSPLTEDAKTFEVCLAEVKANMKEGVLKYFGMHTETSRPSPEMLGYLGVRRDEDDIAFDQVLVHAKSGFVRPKDLERLVGDEDRHARVISAVLRKWLRRWVLPPQTLLADLPHLALSQPWGLINYKDEKIWNLAATCGRSQQVAARDLSEIFRTSLNSSRFSHEHWLGRPAFFLRLASSALESDNKLMASYSHADMPSLVFAEDLSRFVSPGISLEYTTSLDGEFQVRCISNRDKMKLRDDDTLRAIVYSPESLLFS